MLEYLDIAKWEELMSDLSEEDYELFSKHHSSGYICRHDDDGWLKLNGKFTGTRNIETADGIKQFSSLLKFRKEDYVRPEPFEEWVDFDENLHLGIPMGWYILRPGSYGPDRTKVRFFLETSILTHKYGGCLTTISLMKQARYSHLMIF